MTKLWIHIILNVLIIQISIYNCDEFPPTSITSSAKDELDYFKNITFISSSKNNINNNNGDITTILNEVNDNDNNTNNNNNNNNINYDIIMADDAIEVTTLSEIIESHLVDNSIIDNKNNSNLILNETLPSPETTNLLTESTTLTSVLTTIILQNLTSDMSSISPTTSDVAMDTAAPAVIINNETEINDTTITALSATTITKTAAPPITTVEQNVNNFVIETTIVPDTDPPAETTKLFENTTISKPVTDFYVGTTIPYPVMPIMPLNNTNDTAPTQHPPPGGSGKESNILINCILLISSMLVAIHLS